MMKDTRLLIRLKEYVNYASTAESNLAHYIYAGGLLLSYAAGFVLTYFFGVPKEAEQPAETLEELEMQ